MTYQKIINIAAISGALTVILGAFGAHLLKDTLEQIQLSSFKTGNTYQFYHSLLLLFIGILYKFEPSKVLRFAAWTCIIGIVCFSGSLYLLACRDLIGYENTAFIGPITPIGGLFFVSAWVLLAFNFIGRKNESV